MPNGTGAAEGPTTKLFMDSAFLMTTVQMVAPMSSVSDPSTANRVERKKSTVCLSKPLQKSQSVE